MADSLAAWVDIQGVFVEQVGAFAVLASGVGLERVQVQRGMLVASFALRPSVQAVRPRRVNHVTSFIVLICCLLSRHGRLQQLLVPDLA